MGTRAGRHTLEVGQHLLAARRGVAADHMDEALGGQHAARQLGVVRVEALGIELERVEREWEGRVGVNFFDGEQRSVAHRAANRGIWAARREQQPDADGGEFDHVLSHQQKSPPALAEGFVAIPQMSATASGETLLSVPSNIARSLESRRATILSSPVIVLS